MPRAQRASLCLCDPIIFFFYDVYKIIILRPKELILICRVIRTESRAFSLPEFFPPVIFDT